MTTAKKGSGELKINSQDFEQRYYSFDEDEKKIIASYHIILYQYVFLYFRLAVFFFFFRLFFGIFIYSKLLYKYIYICVYIHYTRQK